MRAADGRPLPLLHAGRVHAAVLNGPAAFSVMLEWAVPLDTCARTRVVRAPVAGRRQRDCDRSICRETLRRSGSSRARHRTADGRGHERPLT